MYELCFCFQLPREFLIESSLLPSLLSPSSIQLNSFRLNTSNCNNGNSAYKPFWSFRFFRLPTMALEDSTPSTWIPTATGTELQTRILFKIQVKVIYTDKTVE